MLRLAQQQAIIKLVTAFAKKRILQIVQLQQADFIYQIL
jgi:DNA replicative helicase MCM subunit Mcm2 (Cdc46/Mcm family)